MPPKVRRHPGKRRIPVPFPWDPDLPANQSSIQTNYNALSVKVVDAGLAGDRPTDEAVRAWHKQSVRGVRLAEPAIAGGYRGEGPPTGQLATYLNGVNNVPGAPAAEVGVFVARFFAELDARLDDLDARRAAGATLTDLYADVVRTAAWVHGQWVRIHPFADHNGSTARLLTINVGLLYGVHFKLPGKPRTDMPSHGLVLDYNLAAASQMQGNDQNMVLVLDRLAR